MQDIHNKIAMRGIESLTDSELLSLLLEDRVVAASLLDECGTLVSLAQSQPSRLRMISGLGTRRALLIHASAEFGRRIASANKAIEETITSSDDVVRIMRPRLKELKHEECWAIYLTNSNRIIESRCISQGGVQATVVDHRLIVKRALELLATRLIIVHNHPSGNINPSPQDDQITQQCKTACQAMDIRMLDHVIVTANGYYSYNDQNKL